MAKLINFWNEELDRCKDQKETEGYLYALKMLAYLEREAALLDY